MGESGFRHVGVVVADIDAARERLTELLGIEWGPVKTVDLDARDGDGNAVVVHLRICLSVAEPGFELIEEAEGTPWVRNEHSNLHHISFFSSDVAAHSDELAALGCPLEIAINGPGEGAPLVAAYHTGEPLGIRIERSAIP